MRQEPTTQDPLSRLIDVLTRLFGLLAGAAAILYILGGIVEAGRLFLYRMPVVAIVGQLPNDLLLTVGLGEVMLPTITTAIGYAIVRSLIRMQRPAPGGTVHPALALPWRQGVSAVGSYVWREMGEYLGLGLVVSGLIFIARQAAAVTTGAAWSWRFTDGVLVVLAALAGGLLARTVEQAVASGHVPFITPRAGATIIPVCAAVVLIWTYNAISSPLPDAELQAPGPNGSCTRGWLIAATDRVYLGQTTQAAPGGGCVKCPHVMPVPERRYVTSTKIGDSTLRVGIPLPPPTAPVKGSSSPCPP